MRDATAFRLPSGTGCKHACFVLYISLIFICIQSHSVLYQNVFVLMFCVVHCTMLPASFDHQKAQNSLLHTYHYS